MKKPSQLLRKISVSKRIVVLILLVSIFPIILVGGFGYVQAKNAIYKIAGDYNIKLVAVIKQNIELRLQSFVNLTDELILNSVVRNTLETYDEMNSTQKYWAVQEIYSEVRSKYTQIADISDIRIITSQNTPIYNTGFLYLDSEQEEANFQKISQQDGSMLWYSVTYDGKPYLLLSREVTNLSSGETLGYILLHINADVLTDLYSQFTLNRSAYIVLLDAFGGTLTGTVDFSKEEETTFSDILSLPKSEAITRYSGSPENFIYYSTIEDIGLTLVTSIPYSALTASIQSIVGAICIFVLLCILMSAAMARYIWGSITKPLSQLVSYIKNSSDISPGIAASDPVSFPADNSRDELDFMTKSYSNIIQTLRDTISQMEKEQEEKRKTEIKMLQAQINPHFLFNTLDSLRFTAMMSHADTVSEGLSSLSHILRNSIIGNKAYIKLSEEIKCIEDYIVIQKLRHGESIELNKEIDSDAADCMIMKFLLQPVVENSIIHGMQKKETIKIAIRAHCIDDKIEIIIADNGTGFNMEEKIDQETNVIKSSKLSGIGLENIRQRLELGFRANQTFEIHSEEGVGTTVLIRYPAWKETK